MSIEYEITSLQRNFWSNKLDNSINLMIKSSALKPKSNIYSNI